MWRGTRVSPIPIGFEGPGDGCSHGASGYEICSWIINTTTGINGVTTELCEGR